MTKKSHAMNVSIILGVGVVLMLFIFLLVGHHRDIPNRVRLDRGALLGTGSNMAERIKPVAQVNVASAEKQREPAKNVAAAPPRSRDGQQVYSAPPTAMNGENVRSARN